uniref:Uncharacterized protein n=1 Tax=Cyprinus carpio TaxID=7962 RepID=A0A8C1YI76_CYPCA
MSTNKTCGKCSSEVDQALSRPSCLATQVQIRPSYAVALGWRPSCAVVLGWRPSCAVALGWRPPRAVGLGWPPSCAMALGWRPSCALLLGWRPSCAVKEVLQLCLSAFDPQLRLPSVSTHLFSHTPHTGVSTRPHSPIKC